VLLDATVGLPLIAGAVLQRVGQREVELVQAASK